MLLQEQNPYEFIPKPFFPVVGKIYSDSIDWTKNKVDGYSMAVRHTGTVKKQEHSDKARKRSINSSFNTAL